MVSSRAGASSCRRPTAPRSSTTTPGSRPRASGATSTTTSSSAAWPGGSGSTEALRWQLPDIACGVLVDPQAQRLAPQPLLSAGTATQPSRGRTYNGEVWDLFECVLFKVLSPEEGKLDDRFRLGVWVGKTSRSDDHLIFDGDELWKCWTVMRRPEYLRRDRGRVDAHPQRPRPPQERAPRDRPRRYITWTTYRSMAGHPTAGLARWTGPATRRSAASASRRSSRRRTRRRR